MPRRKHFQSNDPIPCRSALGWRPLYVPWLVLTAPAVAHRDLRSIDWAQAIGALHLQLGAQSRLGQPGVGKTKVLQLALGKLRHHYTA